MGVLAVNGTQLEMDDRPFYYQGLSFFNALYNSAFNENNGRRRHWLSYFKSWGITAVRVWCDWRVRNGWIDEGPENSLWLYPGHQGRNVLYEPEGDVASEPLTRLKRLLTVADELGMVVELAIFTHYLVYPLRTRDDYVARFTRALRPWRNCIFQVWNEYDNHTLHHLAAIKREDPNRLVTNSPGPAGILGDADHNQALDLLTPHTSRHNVPFWEVAPEQIAMLMETYGKPVIDDEPARTGIRDFGGRPDSRAEQHLLHIDRLRACGGYHVYHHDFFQNGYGHPATPPLGIPNAEFSPFHKPIFEHLRRLAPKEILQV